MRAHLILVLMLIASAAKSQTIEIVSVVEKDSSVEISISTDLATPFDVMAGISLAGQGPRDVFIGNDVRYTITSQGQILTVPTIRNGESLPYGEYRAEVNFYPRWGANNSPDSTKTISEQIEAVLSFTLQGSGTSANVVVQRETLQLWVMLNTSVGDVFDLSVLREHLGDSEAIEAPIRIGPIRAHYFPDADITLFEDMSLGTLLDWEVGRQVFP